MAEYDDNNPDEFEGEQWEETSEDAAEPQEYEEGVEYADEYADGEAPTEGEEYAEEYVEEDPDSILPEGEATEDAESAEGYDDSELPLIEGVAEEEEEEEKIGTSIYEVMIWVTLGAVSLGILLMLLEMMSYDMLIWPPYK